MCHKNYHFFLPCTPSIVLTKVHVDVVRLLLPFSSTIDKADVRDKSTDRGDKSCSSAKTTFLFLDSWPWAFLSSTLSDCLSSTDILCLQLSTNSLLSASNWFFFGKSRASVGKFMVPEQFFEGFNLYFICYFRFFINEIELYKVLNAVRVSTFSSLPGWAARKIMIRVSAGCWWSPGPCTGLGWDSDNPIRTRDFGLQVAAQVGIASLSGRLGGGGDLWFRKYCRLLCCFITAWWNNSSRGGGTTWV